MIEDHVAYSFKNNEDRDAYYRTISELHIPEKTRRENGNYKYDYYIPLDRDNTIFLLEQWENTASIDAHCTQPHYLQMGEIKKKYVTATVIVRYRIEKA